MTDIKSIELFAGAGGLALGAEIHEITPVKVVEWNADCRNTIKLNRIDKKNSSSSWPQQIDRDVRDADFTELEDKVEIVTGGPPCQPFSMGGKHQAQADQRDMFPEAVRAVRETRPKAFVFENVRGLTRETFQPYFEYLTLQMRHPQIVARDEEDWSEHLSRLQKHHTSHADNEEDYRVVTQVLNAADYGVPQQRHRVFFVGFRADLGINWYFPKPTHSKEALIEQLANGNYAEKHQLSPNRLSLSTQISQMVKRHQHETLPQCQLLPWRTVRDSIHDLPYPKKSGELTVLNHRLQSGAKVYPGHTGSPLDLPSKALKAGVHGVPGGENMMRHSNGKVRYFTIRESARLQTFPDDYEITGSWSEAMRQLGNAVPVQLASAVMGSVKASLQATSI